LHDQKQNSSRHRYLEIMCSITVVIAKSSLTQIYRTWFSQTDWINFFFACYCRSNCPL